MRKVLKFQCPCGYYFEIFGIANDAVFRIKTHFERFHKSYLPFGITNDEALALLKEKDAKKDPKILERITHSTQTKPKKNSKKTTVALRFLLEKILGADIE